MHCANSHLLLLQNRQFPPCGPGAGGKQREIPYYTDAGCTACGTCETVCPSGKVQLVDGRVVWNQDMPCYYCYACFNFCPEQAILIRDKYTVKEGRYHHPGISAEDIASQKG